MAAIVEMCSLSRSTFSLFSKNCKGFLFTTGNQFIRKQHNESTVPQEYDIVIVGGGMIGTTLACALANNKKLQSKRILLLENSKPFTYETKEQYSNRVVALNKNTRILLSSIGAWKHIEAVRFTPVQKLQIWDACSDAMITFNEDQLSEELAYVVENDLILHAVNKVLSEKHVDIINEAKISNIYLPPENASFAESTLQLEDGKNIKTKLLIGADGAKSKVRETMGVQYMNWDYEQMAVVATLKLSESTENIVAWQRFLPTGPIALLPLTNTLSSLVWSTTPDEARRLTSITEEEFVDSVNDALWRLYQKDGVVEAGMKALHQLLEGLQLQTGNCRQLPPSVENVDENSRAAFPLSFGHAVNYVQSGVALVGDAAHKVHPLAGQGVNLGFGDITVLTQVLSEAVSHGAIIGDVAYLYKYERARQMHNIPTMLAIDALHRLYKGTAAPIVLARSLGLQLTNAISPLKKLMMQHASEQKYRIW